MTNKTKKQYKQMWLALKAKSKGKLKRGEIWTFQESILSVAEANKSSQFKLKLKKSDPRYEVMQLSDAAWSDTVYSI